MNNSNGTKSPTTMTSRYRWLSFVALLLASQTVLADEPNGDYYFDLPAGARDSGVESLQVSVDDYDMSAFSALEDERLRLSPGAPMTPGEHRLVLLAFFQDGSIQTLLEQTFTVQGSIQRGRWSALLSNQFRADDHPDEYYADSKDSLHQLTLNGATEVVTGNWKYTAKGTYIAANQSPVAGSDSHGQLPDYQMAARYANDNAALGVLVGDTPAMADNLIMSQFNRRGVAVEAGLPQQGISTQLMVSHSEPTSQINEGLVLPDTRKEQTQAALVQWQPFREQPGWLKLSASYLNGESDLVGLASVGDDNTLYGGDAWNVGIDSWLLDNSVWLQGGWAESQFDLDGLDQGESDVKDDAAQATVQFSSDGSIGTPSFIDRWVLGYHWQEVGLNFYSLGNIGLPGDVAVQKLYGQFQLGGWNLDWSAADEHTDVEDDPERARQNNELYSAILQYNLAELATGWRFWVMPSGFFIQAQQSTQSIETGDELLAGFAMDLDLEEYTLGLQWQYETLFWSLQQSFGRTEDNADSLFLDDLLISEAQPLIRSRSTQWRIQWQPTADFQIGPWIQWTTQDQGDDEYLYRVMGLAAHMAFPDQRITVDLDYNLERNHSDFTLLSESQLTRQHLANLDVRWTAIEAHNSFAFIFDPAVILYCQANYGRNEDVTLDDQENNWQILLGADLQWGDNG